MSSHATPPRRPHIVYVSLLILLTLWMSLPGLASIPVIDRDEARYAQATVQMTESGDYLNIKFQDRARNKKPAGIYWMQAAPVKALNAPGERRMWPHRIPSVLGAIIAVLATYWGGINVFGRKGAFISAGFLAVSVLFVFEAHVAKTDAMLCAMSAVVLACLLRLRHAPARLPAILLWISMGVGIMIKGPIVPALLLLTLAGLAIWERRAGWMRALINWPGIILCLLIIVPWAVMITIATDGAFFKDAIGRDLAPKLAGGQEKHGAPPGYYLAALPLLFWPGSLVLLSGLVFGIKAARQKGTQSTPIAESLRVLIVWIIPFWILLEIVPTKLPNYLLPVYPALALLCGGAAMAMLQVKAFPRSQKLGAVLFFLASLILVVAILGAGTAYSERLDILVWTIIPLVALIFLAAGLMWANRPKPAIAVSLILTLLLTPFTYHFIMPRLDTLFVARKIEAKISEAGVKLQRHGGPQVYSPQFTEPSLVFRLGSEILLGDKTDQALAEGLELGDILLFDIVDTPEKTALQKLKSNQCFEDLGLVNGLNYSRGDLVNISVLRVQACGKELHSTAPSTPGE